MLSKNASDNLQWWREQDRGQSDALNRLLSRLNGDIVGWLNADEMYTPGALKVVRDHFASNPDCQIVYGDTIFVDENGSATRLLSRHRPSLQVLRSRGCYISSCSTFIRREALREFQFDTRLRMIMDWDLLLELWGRRLRFDYLELPLGMFRVHGSQVTAQRVSRWSEEHLLVRRKHGLVCNPRLVPLSCLVGDMSTGC